MFDKLIRELEPTEAEQAYFDAIDSQSLNTINVLDAVSRFHAAKLNAIHATQLELMMERSSKRIAEGIDRMIASNTALAAASDRHSGRLLWLTVGLIVVGVAQVVATVIAALLG